MPEYKKIHDYIYSDGYEAKNYLDFMGESCWVDDRNQIVFNETAFVSCAVAFCPESVFQRRERTYPAIEFYQYTPHCCGQVKKDNPFTPEKK